MTGATTLWFNLAMAKHNKVHTNLYLDPDLFAVMKQEAKDSKQTLSWVMENTLAVAFGLRDWPKPPKGMKKAKEIAKK